MIIYTEDQKGGTLRPDIVHGMEPWGSGGSFFFVTKDYELSSDELKNFWTD